jgi:hypothetical protein
VLVGFHTSVELLFGYGFYGNITADLIFLVLMPFLRAPVRARAPAPAGGGGSAVRPARGSVGRAGVA